MLRGAQTPGELRARSERLHDFASVAEVDECLEALASRGLAVRFERRPGQKEARWGSTGRSSARPPRSRRPTISARPSRRGRRGEPGQPASHTLERALDELRDVVARLRELVE